MREAEAPPRPPCRPRVLRTLKVRNVSQVTPRVTRITLTGGYWQVGESNYPDHDYGEDVT